MGGSDKRLLGMQDRKPDAFKDSWIGNLHPKTAKGIHNKQYLLLTSQAYCG